MTTHAITERTPAATAELVAYHWIITLQRYAPGGALAANTIDGSANLPAGASRSAAFKGVMNEARRMIGLSADEAVVVLFFPLERDEL
jgi:hypothetical protein